MGTRVLQLLMVTLLAGFVGWASAIFFGPWVLTKYLKSHFGDALEISTLKVTPKLVVTASRVQLSDEGVVVGSLNGVEVDWRLFLGDEPALLLSVANAQSAESFRIEGLKINFTSAENDNSLDVSGIATKAGDSSSASAFDVKFDAQTDYTFQTLRRLRATAGKIETKLPAIFAASGARFEVEQIDLDKNLMEQDVSGRAALKNFEAGELGLTTPQLDIDFNLGNGLVSLVGSARELNHDTSDILISDLTGSIDYNITRSLLSGPISLAINDFSWNEIRLKNVKAITSVGNEQVNVLVEGASLGNEITLGGRYLGRTPDGSFRADIDVLADKGDLKLSGEAILTAVSEPVELDMSVEGYITEVAQPMACSKVACKLNNVTYEYVLSVAGETLSGVSRCEEATCSMAARTHNLSTTNTNNFFGNLQSMNLINPLILGIAYAQMLNGVAIGLGHEINF